MKIMTERKLSIWQRLSLWARKYAYLEHREEPGWKEALPIYIFKCEKHGWQESHNAGRTDKMRLWCKGCQDWHRF